MVILVYGSWLFLHNFYKRSRNDIHMVGSLSEKFSPGPFGRVVRKPTLPSNFPGKVCRLSNHWQLVPLPWPECEWAKTVIMRKKCHIIKWKVWSKYYRKWWDREELKALTRWYYRSLNISKDMKVDYRRQQGHTHTHTQLHQQCWGQTGQQLLGVTITQDLSWTTHTQTLWSDKLARDS